MRSYKYVGQTEEEAIKLLEEETDKEIENFFYKTNKVEEGIEVEAVRIDETSSYGAALIKVFLKNFLVEFSYSYHH